jgi:hypothetical protein
VTGLPGCTTTVGEPITYQLTRFAAPVFDGDQEVGVALGEVEGKTFCVQCVRLNQHTLQFDGLQQLPQGLNFTTSASGVGGLGNRHAHALGVEAHLSDETCCAGLVLGNGAP